VGRPPALEVFMDEGLSDPGAISVARKVTYRYRDDWVGRAPEPGAVEVRFSDGTVRREQVDVALGDPRRPLGFGGVTAKFLDCARHAGGWASSRADAIRDLVEHLEDLSDVRELTRLLGREANE
jgi:2-methylcitrate dehydratase PrpD